MSAMELFSRVSNDEFEVYYATHPTEGFRVGANEVARVLGYRDAPSLARSIPEGEKGYTNSRTPGGGQRILYLTRKGFLRALGQRQTSKIKDADARDLVERFQDWVYGEVLPAVLAGEDVRVPAQRAPEADLPVLPRTYSEALRELAAQVEATELAERAQAEAESQVATLTPLAAIAQDMIDAGSDLSVGDAAKALNRAGVSTGRNRLMKYLREIGWVDRTGHPYQAQVEAGRLTVKVGVYDHPTTGEATLSSTPRVTGKGLAELHYRLTGQLALNA